MRLAPVRRRLRHAVPMPPTCPPAGLASAGLLAASLLLAGCGMGPVAANPGAGTTAASLAISGRVHGGLAPVSGATIQLWQAGTAGNGSAAGDLLNNVSVLTDANGAFSITGDYVCPSPTTQVYLTSVGGNPGLADPHANIQSLVMVSALGNCGNLSSSSYIFVNEISTAAAAWALAPFFAASGAYGSLGARATNATGLANAFLNAQLLASTPSGQPATLPASILTESAKLITLANALASCSDSDGGTACDPLYAAATPPGGTRPSNTLSAALNIVRNPGNDVAAVFAAAGTQPPYSGGLSAAPNDWTMSVKFLGGGIVSPYGLGVDKLGNVWTVNYVGSRSGSLTGFSPQGAALGAGPYGVGTLQQVTALAVDANNDIWTASQNGSAGTLFKFHGATSGAMGALALSYSDRNLDGPSALAYDPDLGTILVSNYYDPAIVIVNLNGTLNATLTSPSLSDGSALISDRSGGAWVTSYNTGAVVHLLSDGTSVPVACCDYPDAIANDGNNNFWVANFDTTTPASNDSTVGLIGHTYTVIQNGISGGGIFQPASIATDAGAHLWIDNFNAPANSPVAGAASFSELNAGTVVSPEHGFGLDAGMKQPRQVVPDASGTLWFADSGGANPYPDPKHPTYGRVVGFLGMATPTATPSGSAPQLP